MRSYTTLILAFLFFPLCLYGCVRRHQTFHTIPSPDIGSIIESIKKYQIDLKCFRGVGRFKSVRGADVKTFRMAWIGTQPQNLRVETLGPWGQITLTFIINGSRFFIYSSNDNRYFKGKASTRNISRFLSIPLRAGDLVGLLSGQPPIFPFHHAKIQALTAEDGWLLSLYKKWGRLIEKIWLNKDAMTVDKVEVFDGWGNLQYRVLFSEHHKVESLCLPHRLSISDRKGPLWSLTVEKYWTKVSISDEAYTLEVPGAKVIDLNS